MADESIIANLKSEGIKELITDLSGASKGFSLLDKSIAEAQKKLTTLDQSSQEFKDLTKEINAASTAMEAFNQDTGTLKKELRDTTNEIGNLERSLKELEKTGQKNTQVYKDLSAKQDELKKKAGQLKDTVNDLNAEIKNSGSDTKNLDKALRAINTVAAGYQAAQGALVLFGGENKKFEQTLLKLNAVMAITQGLQQIQNELSKKDSIFTIAATKAKQLYTAAIGESVGALKALKIAFISTGIGALIVGVITLIANFDKLTESGGLLGKTLSGIGNAIGRLIQGYKDLSDAIGLTDFAGQQAAENEKKRKEDELDDLDRNYKKKIAILKIQHKETAQEELKELKRKKALLEQEFKDANDKTEKQFDDRVKALKDLKDEIEIKEAEIAQIQIDETVRISKQRKDEKEAQIKNLKNVAGELSKSIKAQREAEARHQKQKEDFAKAERERIEKLARIRKEASDEYINQLEAQDQREKDLRRQSVLNAIDLEEKTRKARLDREQAEADRIVQIQKEHSEKVAFILQQIAQIADEIGNITSQAISIRATRELDELEKKKEQGLISEKKYEKESAKIKEEAAKKQRAADIAIAIAKIPLIFLQALTSAPPPFGLILASIASGIALAQVAILAASPLPKFKKGGQVSEKLGLIKGKSHSQGGVPIEVEGEEYVMPVEETRKNIKALKAIHEGKFDKLFVPRENLIQPDIFANIPNPANIDSSILIDKEDYSSINSRLDKVASELYWLTNETKKGNKSRERGTEKVVKTLQNKSKRYV